MKKLFLSLLAILLCGAGYAQISIFPYSEGFEGGDIPAGWTQEETGSSTAKNWIVVATNGGMFLDPVTTHGGNYKAVMETDITGGSVAKLITPSIDLSGVVDPQLKFWHVQKSFLAVNLLKVYYKTAIEDTWILLETYDTEVTDWTQATLNLPNPSSDYYIAFESHDLGGYGTQLDDIKIAAAPTGPVIEENISSWEFGDVYNNLPFGGFSNTYTIKNTGITNLTVDSIHRTLTDPRITVTGLPVTIAPSEQQDITVELDADGLPVGFFNGDLVLVSNDPATPQFTVEVKAASKAADISTYIYETFGTGYGSGVPSNWTCINTSGFGCRFLPTSTDGIGGSPCIGVTLDPPGGSNSQETVQTNYVSMGLNPVLSFNYKVLQQPPMGFDYMDPVAVGNFTYAAYISKDNGATWNNLPLTPNGSHNASTDFTFVSADVSAYAGEICLVRIALMAIGSAPDTKAFLDDIIIGSAPANELAAVSIKGLATPTATMPENYTVQVKNLGATTQTSYTVRLMKKGVTDTVIDSLPGQTIAQDETKDFVFEWTPDAEGAATLYGEVVFAEDEFPVNNKTGELSVTVQPNTFRNVSVGTGTDKYYFLPYNTYYLQSLTQSIYYPHELKTNGGEIHSLTYQAEIVQGVVNLQNVPIQIWMGETDKENFEDGWVDPATLTLVYDGIRDFPVGQYDVTVKLDVPYEYKGGNLVVYSFKQKIAENGYGNLNDGFTSTTYPGSSRSIGNFIVDDVVFDPAHPDSIEMTSTFDFIPNTNFAFDFENAGSLKGKVDNGEESLDGAKVRIIGTELYALTDASGNYELPYLVPDNYRIEVSMHGYFADTLDVTITADISETQDATLLAIPTYTVSGKVTGSNAPEGLADVEVSLFGYERYTTTTNAAGEFSLSGVYQNNTYRIRAKKALYGIYDSTVTVITADTIHNLSLTEVAYPVFSAMADKVGDNVIVSWEAPVAGRDTAYTLDDGTAESGEGVNGGYNVWLGNQYLTNEEGVLKSIDLFGFAQEGASEKTVTIEIFNANQELVGSSDPFRIPEDSWINVPLANIPYSGTFYVMVRWRDAAGSTNHIGADENGPHYRESLSMVYDGTGWATFQAQVQKRCVFLIRPNGLIIDETVTPTPNEYTVYRFEQGEEELTEQWTELSTVNAESCTDADWMSLEDGNYRYAVTATYTGEDNISKPVFTVTVIKSDVGISDVESKETLHVYPNPVTTVLNIQTDATIHEIVVIDQNGRVVKVQRGSKKQIDLSALSAGYYIARIRTEAGLTSVKVVKQ